MNQGDGKKDMSIVGIGPSLAIAGAAAALIVIVLRKAAGWSLALPGPWHEWAIAMGMVLGAAGFGFWISSVVQVKRAHASSRLVTTGVYGLSRNPMYAAFIVFLVPALALFLNEALLFLVSVFMFIVFKMRIWREEAYLAGEFGEEYERYRRSVSQLVPFIRL